MQNLDWSDNNCTVGSTCIHGYFVLPELKEIMGLQTECSITPTFSGLNSYRTSDLFADIERNNLADQIRCYYVSFPWRGSEALILFLLMHDIKMSPEVKEKVERHMQGYWAGVMARL